MRLSPRRVASAVLALACLHAAAATATNTETAGQELHVGLETYAADGRSQPSSAERRRLQLIEFGLSLAQQLGDSIIDGNIDQAAEILVDAVRGGDSGSVVRGLSMANDKPGIAQTIVRALGLGLDSHDLEDAVETGGQEQPEAADVVRDVLVVIDGNFVPGTQTADGQVILDNGSPAFASETIPPSSSFVGEGQASHILPPSSTVVESEHVPGLSNPPLPTPIETSGGTIETTQSLPSVSVPDPAPPIIGQDQIIDRPDPDIVGQPDQHTGEQPVQQQGQQLGQEPGLQLGQPPDTQPEEEPQELPGQIPDPFSPMPRAFVNGKEVRLCRGQKEEQCCAEFSNTDFNIAVSNNDLTGCLCDFTRQCRFEFINEEPPIIMDTRRPDMRSCMCP